MPIFLDFNATTPVDPNVQETICSVLKNSWANPSSSYIIGKDAKNIVDSARDEVAGMIGAVPEEIVFTSGGTESNNMVIQTVIQHYVSQLQSSINDDMDDIPHIITTNIEHDSVKLPLEVLAKEGKAYVTFVPVSKMSGYVDVDDIINEIRPNTRLITIMLANNETGIIQPVSVLKDYVNSVRRKSDHQIYIHTDAAQAIGKIDVNVHELGVDYLTIVGHKFYGPRNGALYFRKTCPLIPIFYGGGQERNYRPGTENTCMIAGLGAAARLVTANLKAYTWHMSSIRHYLEDSLNKEFLGKVIFNVHPNSMRLPNTASVAFDYDNITGKMLLSEASDIFASTGAACHSGGKPSPILVASGVTEAMAAKTLRLSVGRETTKEDIDIAVKCLKDAISTLSSQNI